MAAISDIVYSVEGKYGQFSMHCMYFSGEPVVNQFWSSVYSVSPKSLNKGEVQGVCMFCHSQ